MPSMFDPFTGSPVDEVPLANAPLERVIAQVRYPLVLAVDQSESIVPFQEAVAGSYPLLEEERVRIAVPQSDAVAQVHWRFHSADRAWCVTLNRGFLAIETTTYQSRDDFIERFRHVVAALGEHVAPVRVLRLGVRYIDRLRGAAMDQLARLLREEMRGVATASVARHCLHSMTESMFEVDGARLLARWGLLPPRAVSDPSLEPVPERTWMLDLDMGTTEQFEFDVDATVATARDLASRIYQFFRWAVTDEFLEEFGGVRG